MNADELIKSVEQAVEKGLVYGYVHRNAIYLENTNKFNTKISDDSKVDGDKAVHFVLKPNTDFYDTFYQQLSLWENWHRLLPKRISEMFKGEKITYVHVDPIQLRIDMNDLKKPETRNFFRNVKDTSIHPLKTSFKPSRQLNATFVQLLNSMGLRRIKASNDLADVHIRYGISNRPNLKNGSQSTFHLLPDGRIIGTTQVRELHYSAHYYVDLLWAEEFEKLAKDSISSFTTQDERL